MTGPPAAMIDMAQRHLRDAVTSRTFAEILASCHAAQQCLNDARAALEPSGPEPEDKFARLAALQQDWDSYGAPPIAPAVIAAARTWLDEVNVVPCSSGSVQLEWHQQGTDVEIVFREDGSLDVYAEPNAGAPSGLPTVVQLAAWIQESPAFGNTYSSDMPQQFARDLATWLHSRLTGLTVKTLAKVLEDWNQTGEAFWPEKVAEFVLARLAGAPE